MKCARCKHDAKFKERTGGRCPKCAGRFAFEPKNGDVFTDVGFAAAIERVSSNHAVRFTEAHLYYELARQVQRKYVSSIGCLIATAPVLIFMSVIIALKSKQILVFLIPFIGFVMLALAWVLVDKLKKNAPLVTLKYEQFAVALLQWQAAHGVPPKLMQNAKHALPAATPYRALPAELTSYSFDRAVVCDRAETVDLLLANNFHFENNCALLSVDGYPHAVFESVRAMLRRNPRIEVYALHDASGIGHDLARHLATAPEWFAGIGRVTDVGIAVRHAMQMRGLWIPAQTPPMVTFSNLSTEQNAWLQKYQLELAAIRPEQVIKRLFRAMTQPGTEVSLGDGVTYYSAESFGSDSPHADASSSDGGGDSFG
jgi:DNA-directed RNA polymerase subunit RPC12/RpoP